MHYSKAIKNTPDVRNIINRWFYIIVKVIAQAEVIVHAAFIASSSYAHARGEISIARVYNRIILCINYVQH